MLLLLSFLGRSHIGDLGWPAGGSNAFAQAIERRYRALGGTIRFQTRVESILVDGETAVGVRLTDGSELRADVIVSNANGHATIFDMLGGRYANAAIRRYYSAPEDRIEMGIHVSLGVDRDLSAEPHAIVLPLEPPVTIAGEERHRLYVEPFGFDASMAPKGKTVLKVVLATSFSYWKAMQHSRDRYQQEKHRVSEQVIDLLEKRFPGLRRQIEVIDVATPLTTLQITGNGHGYHAPASAMVRALFTGRRLSQTLPGLRQFYMVGQWAGIGGIPMVAAMGRDVVRAICRADRR
jgi:phytoene dehydrogenase-like protein